MALDLVVAFGPDGTVETYGTIHVRDGTSNTVLIAESAPQSSCADSDGDGTAGVAFLQVAALDPYTGERLLVVIVPAAGELDDRGSHDIRIEVGRHVIDTTIDVIPIPAGPSGLQDR